MKLCEYGCGREARFPFKNGKWCCSESYNSCPVNRNKISIKMKETWKDLDSGLNSDSRSKKISNSNKAVWEDPESGFNSISCKEKKSKKMKEAWHDLNSGLNTFSWKEKQSKKMKEAWKDLNSIFNSDSYKEKFKSTIKKINKKYPLFSKIEEMRYNPDKPEEKEIQVHCKNHECKNSKEKDGWFTPTKSQLYHRINTIENPRGFGESNFYCCQECKDTCYLYNVYGDPLKENNLPYTAAEYQTCRTFVFERENGLCEYCGEPATDMHHIFPVKLEPFFALDPDYCVACCEKHHYEYAHKDECSTGNLSKIVCSVESQKFLNQKIGDA